MKQRFFYGTFVLVCANILVKIIGAIFKIPLTNLIGASGMGAFSVAYNLYVIMFSVSTAGLPVAISKMISEANAKNRSQDVPKIIKCAFAIFFTFSVILTGLILTFADEICLVIGNKSAYFSIIAIAPSIFLITIVSILRGYYQGHHNMTKTAISQVIEALFKLLIGYFFAKYLINEGYNVYISAAGAIFGVTFGTLLSAIYLALSMAFNKKKYTQKSTVNSKNISKNLVKMAIPITFSVLMISLTNLVDMLTIMNRLQSIGFTQNEANEMYGAYNMALTIYNLPQTIITAISISIIPILSQNYAFNNKQNIRKIIKTALLLGLMIALPCAVGFATLSEELLHFLYYKQPEDVIIASKVLIFLSFSVVFVSITAITNASLQAMSRPFLPIRAIILGVILKFIVNVFAISNASVNISGAALGSFCCFFVIAMANLYEIYKILGKLELKCFKILYASGIMGYIIIKLADKMNVLMMVVTAGAVYFLILLLIKGINIEDFEIMKK